MPTGARYNHSDAFVPPLPSTDGLYTEIVTPLTNLTKKDCKWHWTEKHDAAFAELKRVVSSAPVLSLPNFDKAFEVHTDASDVAIGGVLVQEGHPIAYESRKLLDREKKYPTHESGSALSEDMEALSSWKAFHCVHRQRHHLLFYHAAEVKP